MHVARDLFEEAGIQAEGGRGRDLFAEAGIETAPKSRGILDKIRDYGLTTASMAGQGSMQAVSAVSDTLGAPVAKTRAMLSGGAALVDRLASEVTGNAQNQTLQEFAQDEAATAERTAQENAAGNAAARMALALRDGTREQNQKLKSFDQEFNPELVRQQKEVGKAEGAVGMAKALWDNPMAMYGTLVQSMPAMAGGVAAGNVAARGLGALGAATGMAPEAAAALATRGASAAGVASEAISSGGGAREGVHASIMALPVEQLAAQSPRFAELTKVGMTPEAAREALANEVAMAVSLPSSLATAGGSMLTNKLLGDTSAKMIAGQALTAKQAAAIPLKEGAEELTQGLGEDYAQYRGMKSADRDAKYDPGASAVQNFLAGVGMSAPGAAGGMAMQKVNQAKGLSPDGTKKAPGTAGGPKATAPAADQAGASAVGQPTGTQSPSAGAGTRSAGVETTGVAPGAFDYGTYDGYRTALESGGNPNARAGTSSATGLHQFIADTWLNVVAQAKPAWAQGMSREELLAQRTDPARSTQMVQALDRQNSDALRAAGLPVNNYTLYAAHHFGPGAAVKFGRASASTPMADLLTPAQMDANPYLKGKTKGEAVANWDRRAAKAGVKVTPENVAAGAQQESADGQIKDISEEVDSDLLTPRALTDLDKVGEVDQEIAKAEARWKELDPADGYGPTFDAERAALQQEIADLRTERDNMTQNWPKPQIGKATSFTTETGARLDGHYAVVDVSDLLTSHDENLRRNDAFPAALQPRERDRAASEMQISGIVGKLDPARLGLSADAATGAPIIGADGLVESGNARTIALKRIYQADGQKAYDYRSFLAQNATDFGVTPEQVEAVANPVLVRVRDTPVNRAEFARQANASTVAAMSPSEQARSDAARIDTMEDLTPDDNGEFQTSRDFIRRFMSKLPQTEQAAMVDSGGMLSSAGYSRVRNAVLARAYGDSPVLQRLTESLDDNQRNISRALMIAAPQVAKMRQAIEAGARHDVDITADLMAAVDELARLKDDGGSVRDALAQAGMFGDKYSPETRALMQFLAENARRPRKIAEFIGAYFNALDAAGDPNQGSLLGETVAPSKTDLMGAARASTQGETDGYDAGAASAGPQQDAPGRPGDQPSGGQDREQRQAASSREGGDQGDGAAGAEVASEWAAFPPEMETLGVPRADMPQIKAGDRSAFLQFLEARGVPYEKGVVPATDLKPTQAEFSTEKVKRFAETGMGMDRSVLVSSDGYVLDGHHQMMAHRVVGDDVPVIRIEAPIRELLAAANEFPSVQRSEGATAANDAAINDPRAAAVRDFKDAMADLGEWATKHQRAAIVPNDQKELMPILVKLFDSAIRIVGTDARQAIRWVQEQLRANPETKRLANQVDPSTYRQAAEQALAAMGQEAEQGGLFGSPDAASAAIEDELPVARPYGSLSDAEKAAFDAASRGTLPVAENSRQTRAAFKNAASEDGAPVRGPAAPMPGSGVSDAPSSANLNQRPSGKPTKSSPEKSATNLEPAGKDSGNFMVTSDASTVDGKGSGVDGAASEKAASGADDALRQRFSVAIPLFGDVPYRASAPVATENGETVLSSRVITTATKLNKARAEALGMPGKSVVYAWRVSTVRTNNGQTRAVIEAMAQDHGRSDEGEVLGRFRVVNNPETVELVAPAIAKAARQEFAAQQAEGDLDAGGQQTMLSRANRGAYDPPGDDVPFSRSLARRDNATNDMFSAAQEALQTAPSGAKNPLLHQRAHEISGWNHHNTAPERAGVFLLDSGSYAKFDGFAWYRGESTPRAALKTEIPAAATRPKDRFPDQRWRRYADYSTDAFNEPKALRNIARDRGVATQATANGLTSYTPADLSARADAAAAAQREQARQQQAQDQRAQADAERGGFTLTGSDRTADVAEARGQQAMFSRAPAVPQTETEAFKRWFGKSKVVDADGKPRVVYHGTAADFTIFQKPEVNKMADRSVVGFWFTSAKSDAAGYGGSLMETYLSIQNPRRITRRKLDEMAVSYPTAEMMRRLKAGGHDGLIIEEIRPDPITEERGMPEQYVAFRPEQIKSATGNTGAFDPAEKDIRLSVAGDGAGAVAPDDVRALAARVRKALPSLPEVHVLAGAADAPAVLRDYIDANGGAARGAYHDGAIYLFTDHLASMAEAEHVLATHEANHAGLDALLGPDRHRTMQALGNNNDRLYRAAQQLVDEHGMGYTEAIEEVLADMSPGDLIKLHGWRRVTASVASWLDNHGFTNLAKQLRGWLNGNLTQQQRADLAVAELMGAVRAHLEGRKAVAPVRVKETPRDAAARKAWMGKQAQRLGFLGADDLVSSDVGLFRRLEAQWRGVPAPSMARVDKTKAAKKFPTVLNASGLQLSGTAWQNKPGTRRILTEKHLAGYRKAAGPLFSRGDNSAMAAKKVAGQDQGGAPAGDNQGASMTLFHGGRAVLSSLGGRGRKNRFLYTTPTEVMAKEYGQHVTRLVPDKDARIADLSDPEALYGSQTAVEAIQQYAQENDIDPDDLVAAVADGRAWETYGEYMQDDINDVVGAALGADIIALPDSTFASNPQVQGKTFVVLNKGRIKIASDSDASTSQDAPRLSRAAGGRGFDASNSTLVADFRNDEPLKRHADYKAAKAGDVDAAARLVRDVVKPESLEQSRRIFGSDAIFVPVHAQEASGKNQIPNMLALAHAQAAGASVEQDIKQSNKAFHTGAGAMERLMNRAEFDGAVEPGKSYVLVDDVTTMGSTLADLAAYIQRNGGHVAGSVVLVNAARGSKMQASPRVINQLEARHGQAIREILGIDAAQLTGPEADYLIGFKSADEIRNRATRAEQERSARLRAKEVLPGRPPGVEPKLSRAAVPTQAQGTRTAAQRAEDIIQDSAQTPAPLDAIARILTKYTGVERLTRAAYRAGGRALDRAIPERIKAGVVADYGLPEAVKDQRVLLQARQRVQLRKSGKLVDQLSTLTRAESRIAYEWMNETDPQKIMRGMSALPEESVKVLQQVQQMIDKLSQDAVALGQLDPRSYERNKFAYLRRSYAKHILEQPGAKKARARAVSILGDQYKGRGITENASMAKVRQTAPEWWDVARRAGKADPDLIGRKLVKMERIAPTGAGTRALPGMEGRADGRVLETVYLPADRARPAQYRDWREAGTFEVRDTKGNDLVLWRDYTKDEREQMGEVDEARFAIIKTLHGMIRDVETGRYLEWVAKTYGKPEGSEIDGNLVEGSERLRDTFLPGDWVKVPDTKIAGTQVAKYGKLAGKYVPGPVWNDVRSAVNINPKPLGEVYDKVLNAWKLSKTALSPTVHMNNVMSNFVMADWHGVTAGHIAKALRIIMAAHDRKGVGAIGRAGNLAAARIGIADREAALEIMTRYQDSGGELGSWVTNEIAQDQIQPLLDAMEKELAKDPDSIEAQAGVMSALQLLRQGELTAAARAAAGAHGAKQVIQEGKNLIDLYQNEDAVFRLAAWLKAKEQGASDLDAGKEARKSFLDYNINAPWVTAMRKSAWPFLAFTYRAIPMLLDVAAHKPHKLFKLMAIAGSLNALGTLLAGGDEDEEKRIRRMLPDEKAGSIWGAVPKLIRMPWNDDHGSPVFLDIRRWVPVGDVVDVGQGHSAIPMLPYLMPGGPLATAGELVLNRSQFTGKPITLSTDTPAQQAGKVLDYVYKAFAPNVLGLPGSYATTGVMDAAKGRTDAFGRERSKTQAVASSFGVKLGSYPADVLEKNLRAKADADESEIQKNIGQLKRQFQSNAISEAEYDRGIDRELDKKREIARKLMEKVGG